MRPLQIGWILLGLWIASCAAQTPQVTTTNGPLFGYIDGSVALYLGIPYATAPVGDLRFRSPQPAANWSGVLNATTHGSRCIQFPKLLSLSGDEDCLFLNVHTPADAIEKANKGDPFPVMVWIHGGGFVVGDGYENGRFDARNLVSQRGVILVTLNYRLGAFGFIAHDAFRAEDPDNSTGSYGVQDQRMAMQWVQSNIASFGGDPNAITLFGESAGAFSVCYHLASPASAGLFHAAIMESGTCDSYDFFQPYSVASSFGDVYAEACGCDSSQMSLSEFAACMRALPAASLDKDITSWLSPNWPLPSTASPPPSSPLLHPRHQTARALHHVRHAAAHGIQVSAGHSPLAPKLAPIMPWGIAIDGSAKGLQARPIDQLPQTLNDVPLIIGTNLNEGSIFVLALTVLVPGVHLPITDSGLNLTLFNFFNQSVSDAVMNDIYPLSDFADNDHRAGILLRDYFFVCPTRRAVRALDKIKSTPTYVYQFVYKEDFPESPYLGDYHSSELPFVFNNQYPPKTHKFSANDTHMADIFNTYWTNHAKFFDPNGSGSPPVPEKWPQYDSDTETNVVIDLPPRLEQNLAGARCDYWDLVDASTPPPTPGVDDVLRTDV